MKKFFFVGIVSLLACTADANAAQITTDFTNDTGYTVTEATLSQTRYRCRNCNRGERRTTPEAAIFQTRNRRG